MNFLFSSSVGGIMVSIAAFQAIVPGSLPGHRIFFEMMFSPFVRFIMNFQKHILDKVSDLPIINFVCSWL